MYGRFASTKIDPDYFIEVIIFIYIRKIFSFVKGHVHSIATVPPIPVAAGNGQTTTEIDAILNGAENTMLNKNIRINWYLLNKVFNVN